MVTASERCTKETECGKIIVRWPGLFQLLAKAVQEAECLYPEDALTFEAVNEKSTNMAKRLFPGARSISIYEAGW